MHAATGMFTSHIHLHPPTSVPSFSATFCPQQPCLQPALAQQHGTGRRRCAGRCVPPVRAAPVPQPSTDAPTQPATPAASTPPGSSAPPGAESNGQDGTWLKKMVDDLKAEEDAMRSRREQLELQLMRRTQQEMRELQAQQQKTQPVAGSNPFPTPRKKVIKKSKRMAAVAAAAGVLRVNPSRPAGPSQTDTTTSSSTLPHHVIHRPGSPDMLSSTDDAADLAGSGNGHSNSSTSQLPPAQLLRNLDVNLDGPSESSPPNSDNCDTCVIPKPIFIISDCTGESAARTVRAALNQFELCFKTHAPATLLVFRFVEDEKKAYSIIETAAKEDALVVYTLVNPKALKAVQTACKLLNVRNVDLWSNLLDGMEAHLEATRSGVPMINAPRRPVLSEDYFKMIEAVEYTRKMDDGANPKEWKAADLLILGVSRCGKTPLSIFLGQRGFKVANLPLVPGAPIPRELYEIDQTRIVGLTIDPNVLLSIRRNRLGMMGVKDFSVPIDYAEIQKIHSELDWAKKLYSANPDWPVLDVTLRGVEETAARILKILNDKRGDASPQWVEELYGKMAGNRSNQPSNGPTTSNRPQSPGQVRGFYEQAYMGGEQYLIEGLY